jgi:hypothetical protein
MPCERLGDENIQALFVPRPNGLEKSPLFLLSNFCFAAGKTKICESHARALPGTQKAPVDKPAAAQ